MSNKALILDLDNTLYNWTDAYVAGMQAQVRYLSQKLGRKESTLLKHFKSVFKKYGSVEVPNAVKELGIWEHLNLLETDRVKIEDEAWNLFIGEFGNNLCLFPGVKETLIWAKEKGVFVFGFSDSFSYWINWRLNLLGILNLFDKVYAQDNSLISSCSPVDVSTCSEIIVTIGANELKPSTTVIQHIKTQYGLQKKDIYMIGDSIAKDICTAQASNINDIWAKYGTRNKPGAGAILGTITPWTSEDRKLRMQANLTIKPTYSVSRFEEIKEILN